MAVSVCVSQVSQGCRCAGRVPTAPYRERAFQNKGLLAEGTPLQQDALDLESHSAHVILLRAHASILAASMQYVPVHLQARRSSPRDAANLLPSDVDGLLSRSGRSTLHCRRQTALRLESEGLQGSLALEAGASLQRVAECMRAARTQTFAHKMTQPIPTQSNFVVLLVTLARSMLN